MVESTDQTLEKEIVSNNDILIEHPSNWGLMFYDDDITPVGFVVAVFFKVLHTSEKDAIEFTLKIQEQGKFLFGSFPKSIADGKKEKIDSMSNSYGYPLKVNVEKSNEE